jgi:aminoglycoside phosphotransferase (APT) family kinase protein
MDPRDVLKNDFPALRVDGLKRLGQGWDHVAFLVNEALVFRLPWHLVERAHGGVDAPTALPEVRLLRAVAGHLPVVVPEPVYVADHGQYFGYRYLPGEDLAQLLGDGSWRPDPDGSFADFVTDVVTALEEVVAANDAEAIGVRRARRPRYPDAAALALLRSRLTATMRSVFESAAEALPPLWSAAMARPVATLHADLGLDHWLADGEGPYALIDWSDSCVGPPELQLSTLMWYVPELTAGVARRYADRTNRVIDGDLIFCCGCVNALSDLGEILRQDDTDEEDLEWCLEFLRRWSQADLAVTLRGSSS